MKVTTSLNSPAQYDKSPGHDVLSLSTEYDGDLRFLFALFYQLPELPKDPADQRIDRVYVTNFDRTKRLDLILPKLHPFSAQADNITAS